MLRAFRLISNYANFMNCPFLFMTEQEKKIFDYWEADLQLYHDKLVQMVSEVNKSLVALDLLKENLDAK